MAAITLRQLEIFAQIVELGSFRACARQIGVSQVAISDHVRQLEERLGHQLFERVRGGTSRLTPDGERALLHASKVLRALDRLMAEMTAPDRAPQARKLVISAHSHILRYFQEPLSQFEEEHPDIRIDLDLDIFTAGPLAEKMRDGAVDVGFFYALEGHASLESTLMWHEPLAFFVARDHILAQQERVSPADLLNFPIIRHGPRNALRLLIDEALEQAGLGQCAVATESDNYGLILTSLRNGLGFSCMFESSADELKSFGGLKRVAFDGDIPAIEVRRIVGPGWSKDPILAKLLAVL
jgi:molybdate transport repressor ModE-like protein